jgi:hypothetical protein
MKGKNKNMKAEELRKITEQSELECADEFWEEYKEKLFSKLMLQAKGRQYSITIGYPDELAKTKQGGAWIDYKPLREKVKNELEILGYTFKYADDRQGDFITISW